MASLTLQRRFTGLTATNTSTSHREDPRSSTSTASNIALHSVRLKKSQPPNSSGFRLILSTSRESDLVQWAGINRIQPKTIGVINGKPVNSLRVHGNTRRYYYTCSSGNPAATPSADDAPSSSTPTTPQPTAVECCRYLACVETEEEDSSRRERDGDNDCVIVEPRVVVYKVFECGDHTCGAGKSMQP